MARLPADRYISPWADSDPCPCGRGSSFAKCCKAGPNQLPHMRIPGLGPPGPATGYANPICYMSATNDCSERKSREHYISEAILARFDKLKVSGMPWQEEGGSEFFSAKSLAANILCEKHNNALSPIDWLGLKAFDAFIAAADYAANRRGPGRVEHYLISGQGLELWMYKLAAGFHFAGIAAADSGVLLQACSFPMDELVGALTTARLPSGSHLWVSSLAPGPLPAGEIAVGPLIDVAAKVNAGVQVQFGPLQFQTILVAPPVPAQQLALLEPRHRPRVIDFVGPARDARIVLSWQGWPVNRVNRVGVEVGPARGD